MNPRLLAGTALLLAVFAWEAAAEKARPARPAGKSIEVEVMRGGSVRIPLRGFERNLNRLEYKPIGSPRYGRLSQLEQYNGPERQGPSFVTYTHGNDEDSNEDTFAFEVRAPATGLRGRGRVTIRILDSPAQLLITPSILDFGATAIGDTPVRRTVELANVGGGVIQGFLEIPEPFALSDDGMFVLRRGEKTKIPVIFAPQRAGPYLFPVQPVPGDRATLTLKGEALQPFAVEAAEFEFQEQPDQSRIASAAVKNQSQSPQQISVVLPPDVPVEPVPALDLSPGASTNVTLYIPAATKTRVAPFDVRFETADHAMVLEFQAPPIPPNVIVVTSPDFGPVKPGSATRAALVLSNAGGAVADCRLQIAKNLTTEDGVTAFTIAPGAVHIVALKLTPKQGQDLPTNVVVAFRDESVPATVKAVWAPTSDPSPTPKPSPSPSPAPTPYTKKLNVDIKLELTGGEVFIAYRQLEKFTNFKLQHLIGNEVGWQNYQLPGWLGWIKSKVGRIREFLNKPIVREQVSGMEEDEKWDRIEIASEEIGGLGLWRLIAEPSGQSEPRPVSDEFRITPERLVVVEPETPVKQTEPEPAMPQKPTIAQRAVGPVTKIEGGGSRPERDSALVQVAFAQGLGVRGFRLERGAMVATIDPETHIPQAQEFKRMEPPGAEVELLGVAEDEAEGKKVTVCTARISGLPEGLATFWRIIPLGEEKELPATDIIVVKTLPRPPFPWNTLLLVALTLLLAGVLYLRWRMNRPPA